MKRIAPFLIAFLILGAVVMAWWATRDQNAVPLPDEKKVAMERLVESQEGPRYFLPEPGTKPDEQGILWLDSVKADEQLPRILTERKWGDAEKAKVMKLLEETSEPHPSRAVGGRRINLAKLTVALDELP